jgi:hypothetical protein
MASQSSGDFLKLEKDVATPVVFLRHPQDPQWATNKFQIHHYSDPATDEYYRIACGRTAGQTCYLCDKRDELAHSGSFAKAPKTVQKWLRAQDRHMSRVIPVAAFINLIRQTAEASARSDPSATALQAQLYDTLTRAQFVGWDYPKTTFKKIWGKIRTSAQKFQRTIDPSNPLAAYVVWLTSKENEGGFTETDVEIDWYLPVVIPIELCGNMPSYAQLYDDEVAKALEWPAERVAQLIGMAASHVSDPGMPPASPYPQLPQAPAGVVVPGQYAMQAPMGSASPLPLQPTPQAPMAAPVGSGYPQQLNQGLGNSYAAATPPTVVAGTVMQASNLPCLGKFNASDPKCGSCPAMTDCLQECGRRQAQATAPAQAQAPAPPTAPAQAQAPSNLPPNVAAALAACHGALGAGASATAAPKK